MVTDRESSFQPGALSYAEVPLSGVRTDLPAGPRADRARPLRLWSQDPTPRRLAGNPGGPEEAERDTGKRIRSGQSGLDQEVVIREISSSSPDPTCRQGHDIAGAS